MDSLLRDRSCVNYNTLPVCGFLLSTTYAQFSFLSRWLLDLLDCAQESNRIKCVVPTRSIWDEKNCTRINDGMIFIVKQRIFFSGVWDSAPRQLYTKKYLLRFLDLDHPDLDISWVNWVPHFLRNIEHVPSGKRLNNYEKSQFLMRKLTISMAIFNSYLM